MSNGNWGGKLALVGIATCLLATTWLWLEHSNSPWRAEHRVAPAKQSYERQRQYQQSAQDATAWINSVKQRGSEKASSQGSNTSEDGKDYHDALDLGAQWYTAEAAVSMVNWTILQFFVGVFGLAGLGITIWLTRKTAEAAIDAAKTAKEQADVVRQEFLATHRPKIRLRFTDNISIISGAPLTATLFFSNIGDSEGTVISMSIDFFYREAHSLRHTGFRLKYEASNIFPITVPPGKDAHVSVTGRSFSADELQKVVNGETEICMIGAVLYSDGAGVERATGFFRIYNPKANLFLRAGHSDPWHERDYED